MTVNDITAANPDKILFLFRSGIKYFNFADSVKSSNFLESMNSTETKVTSFCSKFIAAAVAAMTTVWTVVGSTSVCNPPRLTPTPNERIGTEDGIRDGCDAGLDTG